MERIPPPKGDARRPLAGPDHRLLVRPLCGRGLAGAGHATARSAGATRSLMHVHRAHPPGRTPWASSPPRRPSARAWVRARSAISIAGDQGDRRGPGGRHHHPAPSSPATKLLPGFKEMQPAGLRRALPGGLGRLRGSARRPEQAAAQRRLPVLRAGDLPGPGLRLPLRLPRHAAHGDRPGAPGARVRPRPDHHGPHGGLRGAAQRRRGHPVDNPANLPEPNKISEVREPIIEAHILVPQDYLGEVINLCIEKRGVQKQDPLRGRPGPGRPTSCRWPRWCWTSSTGSSPPAAAMPPSSTSSSAFRPPTWSSSMC